MSTDLNSILREVHRLRKHLRDLKNEIDNLPRLKKAHQARVAKQEQALKDAQESVKQVKAANHDREVSLKATHQQLVKYERQLNDMKTPKEVEAMQTEITNAKTHIGELEELILLGLNEIDERVAKLPVVEEQFKKAKNDFAGFDAEMKERAERLQGEYKLAADELKKIEPQVPSTVRPLFDRLVKAHDADALAQVKERDRMCGQCQMAVTAQYINEMIKGQFVCCNNCGRALYLERTA